MTVLAALDPSKAGPGLMGFVVMFGLALAVLLLVRSMAKHLRKVRYSVLPDDTIPGGDTVSADGTVTASVPPPSEDVPKP